MLVLMLTLTLGVKGGIEINTFLPGVNASVHLGVGADARCEYTLSLTWIKKVYDVVMRKEREVYSVSCIGVLPFIEGSLGDGTSGLVAVSRDSVEHA